MKKIVIILVGLSLFLTSCSRNTPKQLVYKHQKEKVEDFGLDIRDIDFKIESIKEEGEVTNHDKARDLIKGWGDTEGMEGEEAFEYIIQKYSKLEEESIKNLEKRERMFSELLDFEKEVRGSKYYDRRSVLEVEDMKRSSIRDIKKSKSLLEEVRQGKNSLKEDLKTYKRIMREDEEVLHYIYKVSYSFLNPIFKIRINTTSLMYTDSDHTKIVEEKEI